MRGEEIAYSWYDEQVEFLNIDRYPDGSPLVKEGGKLAFEGVTRVLLRPRDSAGFLGGIFWIQSLIERGVRPPELIFPCMFGQRQDRSNPTGDVLYTIKFVGKLINSLGLPKVTVLDPHSEATPACIDRVEVVHVDDIWAHHYGIDAGEYEAVVAPDAGAAKRAGRIAEMLKLPLKQGVKKRDVATGKLAGFGVESMQDLRDRRLHEPKVLVVDDLCDGGGTFLGLADELDREGVRADLFVTHGLFTKGTYDLLKRYERLICTDSVAAVRPDTQILFTAEHLLKYGELL